MSETPRLSRIFRDNLSRIFTGPLETLGEKSFRTVPKLVETFRPSRPGLRPKHENRRRGGCFAAETTRAKPNFRPRRETRTQAGRAPSRVACAFAPGQWNDRHSLGKVLDTLPPSPARDSARHALANGADRPTKIALCSKRQMRRIKHRRACLRWKKFVALFSPRKRERFLRNHAPELEFLNLAVATWHVR